MLKRKKKVNSKDAVKGAIGLAAIGAAVAGIGAALKMKKNTEKAKETEGVETPEEE